MRTKRLLGTVLLLLLFGPPTSRGREEAVPIGKGFPSPEEFDRTARYLLKRVEEGTIESRARAARALLSFGEGFRDWARRTLAGERNRIRGSTLASIGMVGDRTLAGDIASYLKDGNEEQKEGALRALALLEAMDTIPQMRSFLSDTSPKVRCAAVEALGAMRDKESLPRIAPLLNDPEPSLRKAAVEAVATLEASEFEAEIRKAAVAEDPEVRRAAIQALGDMGIASSAPLLREQLYHSDPWTRAAAASALGRLLAGDAVPELTDLLKDSSPTVRAEAIRSLAEAGPAAHAAEPRLIRLLDDHSWGGRTLLSPGRNVTVREEAALTLEKIAGGRFGFRLEDPEHLREEAIRAWKRSRGIKTADRREREGTE